MDNLPATITSTIQSASLNRAPSPTHDLAPSSTVSRKLPVEVDSLPASAPQSDHVTASSPTYAVRPAPRRAALPPLPDLRFEQSYLASLKNARGWKAVCWITVRDQVVLPLVQGTLWTLLLAGWRHWNRDTALAGASTGARLRRWWWRVNKWAVPKGTRATSRGKAAAVARAGEIGDFYQVQLGAGGD